MKFDQPPDDIEWNEWGPPVRVQIERGPVMLFARAVKDDSPVYASERAARDAGFDRVPVPPTYTFVMASAGALPDIQPAGGTGSMYASAAGDAASAFDRDGLFLHARQHFTYHQPVGWATCSRTLRHQDAVCVKRGAVRWKSRTSKRAGPTSTATRWSTNASCRSSSRTSERERLNAKSASELRKKASRSDATRGSGSNPTGWKSRASGGGRLRRAWVVLHAARLHDVEAVRFVRSAPGFLSPIQV
jgi:hypothetical protein